VLGDAPSGGIAFPPSPSGRWPAVALAAAEWTLRGYSPARSRARWTKDKKGTGQMLTAFSIAVCLMLLAVYDADCNSRGE
jgi:hypothetical protein